TTTWIQPNRQWGYAQSGAAKLESELQRKTLSANDEPIFQPGGFFASSDRNLRECVARFSDGTGIDGVGFLSHEERAPDGAAGTAVSRGVFQCAESYELHDSE